MSTGNKKNGKNIIIGVAVLVVIGVIAVGAYLGRTKDSTPADTTSSIAKSNDSKGKSDEKDKSDVELKEVRTWTKKDCSLAPWLVTDKLGYFKDEGIKLVFTGELQPNQQIPSIINGNNDVSSAHPNTILVANNGGAKLKGVVRAGIEPDPTVDKKFRHMWWFINPSKYPDVKSIKDLKNVKGKLKFSTITTNICTDFLTETLFDKYGISKDKIEWVTMPDVQAIQALSQKLVDVSAVHPPFYKGMTDAGAIKIADSTETGLKASAGVGYYFFTEDYIKKNPKTVAAFVRAITKGQKWANAHPDETAKWTEKAIGIPVTGSHYYADNAIIVEKEIKPWLKNLEDKKVLPEGKFKPSDIITHQFEKFRDKTAINY